MSTYTPIATQTLTSATATVTFSSIPQNYTDLIVIFNGNLSAAATCFLRYNNDSGSNYSQTDLVGNGSSATSQRRSNATGFRLYDVAASSNPINILIFNINNYSNTTTYKTTLSRSADSGGEVGTGVSLWRNTSAINRLDFVTGSGTWSVGSTFTLHGIAVGNSSAKADGGSSVTTDGTYFYHTFKSSGAFIPRQALTVDYLVVAGGGGGGEEIGGGGGAGGLRSTVTATGGGGSLESALSLTKDTAYTVVIGAGGAGGIYSSNTPAVNGSNSIFSTITSTGGGRGGSYTGADTNGNSGGSGGGASAAGSADTIGGAGTANQGYAGANSTINNSRGAGGGGGAGAVGVNGNGIGGTQYGGVGVQVAITGSSVYYAGGGGGGNNNSSGSDKTSAGGLGGGGAGGDYRTPPTGTAGGAGTAYTGGGGGGGGNNSNGGAGGSGIVIIRYAV